MSPHDPLIAINMAVSAYKNGKSKRRVMEALKAFQESQPDNEALIHIANTLRLAIDDQRDDDEEINGKSHDSRRHPAVTSPAKLASLEADRRD